MGCAGSKPESTHVPGPAAQEPILTEGVSLITAPAAPMAAAVSMATSVMPMAAAVPVATPVVPMAAAVPMATPPQESPAPSVLDGIFRFFAKADEDKSKSIDAAELSRAMAQDRAMKVKLCAVAGVKNPETMSDEQVAIEVLRAADSSGDGVLQFAELEQMLRGWRVDEHQTREDMTQANEQRRLAGARERAERARVEGGGFAGLTDAEEARRIGEASQAITVAEKFTFNESDPTTFSQGAVYALDAAAKAERDETERVIRQQEMDEYLYKEQFKGLTDADEALRVGESVKLGGEVLDIEGSAPRKPMPAALVAKLAKKK